MAASADENGVDGAGKSQTLLLKTLAERKCTYSKLKLAMKYAKRAYHLCADLDGVYEMLTAVKILRHAADAAVTTPHWYKILKVEPFSHINSIKKRFKKLALILNPDKLAFKLVNEAFLVLSDEIRRKEYDIKIRIAMQTANEAVATRESDGGRGGKAAVGMFWTACSKCRLFRQFEKKYLGHDLRCPSCKKSLKAVEASDYSKRGEPRNENVCWNSIAMGRWTGIKVYKRSRGKRMRVDDGGQTMAVSEFQRLAKRKLNEGGNEEDNLQRSWDLVMMPVEDSDFYDFDEGRIERSFKKGQVWAIYDDDGGMPRHYGLIDEVVSLCPFDVVMRWLDFDFQSNGNEIHLEKTGFRLSCGMFKISQKTSVKSLNVFSHVVDCERAVRQVYRIYPKRGSVWALYKEDSLNSEGGNPLVKEKRGYDIVVLTSYNEMHGLSMWHLEKVNGFKAIFKRREIGCHAFRWIQKHDVWLFSHQIPARRLSGEESPYLSGACWELDPASLTPELLTVRL